MQSLVRRVAVPTLGLTLLVAPVPVAAAAPAATTVPARAGATWKPRPSQYPTTVTQKDLAIPMSDGTVLRGDLMRPSVDGRTPVAKRLPVVVTITAYNKSATAGSGLAGGAQDYLVKRGYAQLTVDARGTGDSGGQWCSFCTREDRDSTEVLQWAHAQPWSNGKTAMRGPSYMGINQIFAAAGHPTGLKALFPQVPAGDVYRDVVASGGQLDVGFIPAWLGLVTATGVIPPSTPSQDSLSIYLHALADHVAGALTFTGPLLGNAVLGQEPAYDGPFYAQRSPINVVGKVTVPTFLISGEYDLFQRGTPLLFENLRRRGVPAKLIIGPWNHLQASAGTGLAKAGYGTLEQLQLRWFDHYVKGMPDPTLNSDIAPLTYYEQGTGAWKHSSSWVGRDRHAVTYRLSGSASTSGTAGALTTGTPTNGTADVYPVPVAGLCTRSTDQWTAGIPSQLPLDNPCLTDNAMNDRTGVVFRTAPVKRTVAFQGPINAHLYVSSTSGDGMLSVAVEDEAPDGTVSRLTAGWQVISFRALDRARSRFLDGR
ncbi:MAG: CocE/NonD family hydrolase, partial [Marmoricola sp.]